MKAPIHRLSKKELVWLGSHTCRHGHTYLEHYNCYLQEKPSMEEKIGFLDIETFGLDADFAVMLTWCLKERGGEIAFDTIKGRDFEEHRKAKTLFNVDKRITKNLIEEMLKYDRLVTHYGRKFDIKFIRTRAILDGLDFPHFGTIVNDDTYYMSKNKLKIHSNRLDTVVRVCEGKSGKTHLDGNIWIPAVMGDAEAILYILEHNKIDVIELEKAWEKLRIYQGVRNTSI